MLQIAARSTKHRLSHFKAKVVACAHHQYSSTTIPKMMMQPNEDKPESTSQHHNEDKKNRLNSMQVDATPAPKVAGKPSVYDH